MTRPSPVPESPFSDAVRTARAGGHARAIEQIERALKGGAPSDSSQAAAVEALAYVARLAEAAGDAGQAESALEAALRLQPGYPDLHYRCARLLRDLGRHAEARRALDRALSLNPCRHRLDGIHQVCRVVYGSLADQVHSAALG